MILDYYRLREQPFGATPDSRYLFASETHREALASLLYGVAAGRGFVALIAMPGMGKTTLLFESMRQLRGNAKTVFLFQTISSPLEFLTALLADLGVEETSGGLIALQAKLNDILVEQARRGERLVVVIDEAQNLNDSVLEFARMLSNFETEQQKLVQIILSGQPQLAVKLASPQLMQLRQRISMVAYLRPLSAEETELYVAHRLRLAGHRSDKPLFTSAALQLIARHSKGIPRNINNLCFNALSLGCALKRKMIDAEIIKEVIADLNLDMAKFLEPEPMQKSGGSILPTFAPALKRKLGGWVPILGFAGAVLFVTGWILIDAIR
jgi:general secretion pathway protein A